MILFKKIAAILSIIILIFNTNFAQSKGVRISGKITDKETNEAIIGVNIIIEKEISPNSFQFIDGTASDKDGSYVTQYFPQNKYRIIFKSIGYKEHSEILNFSIKEGTLLFDIQLEPSAVELEEILVRDEKIIEKNVSVINVPTKLLELLPSISGEIDVFRSLQLLPGVKVASELSNGVYIRGGSPDQNLTLVDGAMIYNPAHLGNIASTFNTYAIYDMKLIKGAFPAEYGGRLSSVLDIKLREGNKEKEMGRIGVGTINSHAVIEGPISDKVTYIFSGRVMYYDQLQKVFQKNSVTPRFNFYDANIKLNYEISKNENISLNTMYSKDNIYSSPVNLGFLYNINWVNSNIGLNWIKGFGNDIISSTNISVIGYDFVSSLDDVTNDTLANDFFTSSDLQDFSVKEKVEYKLSDSYTLKTGFEFLIHDYKLVNWIVYDPILETSPDHYEKYFSSELSVFLQQEWDPFPFLNTNLGFRVFKFSQSKDVKIEPRLSLSLSITDNLLLKTAYAEAHQFLHLILRNDIRLPTDLWYPSTKNILPAKSSQYVAGFDYYFNDKSYLVALEGYYKDFGNLYEIQDLPSYSIDKKIEENFTSGKGEAYGIEFFLNKRAGSFIGWIGYTFSYTKRLFEVLNTGRIYPPRYDRRHDVSIVGSYKIFDNFNIGFTWTYSSGPGLTMPTSKYYYKNEELNEEEKVQIYYSARNEFQLSDYHKLDINVKYNTLFLDYPFEFYVNLLNVYNQKNAFTQYISYDYNENTNAYDYNSSLKLRQITLMPFFPTFGFSVKF
ncbi:MAG: TonB-dependent receptor [Ignavibacteriae bacterium]|nr:TonB-dependent receptor [Ignavibacteriota bacterium]